MPRILDSTERQRQAAGVNRPARLARLTAALAMALLLAKGEPVAATPESRAAVLFLLISPSVRVNGMGQAGVALPDEPGGYYNPGAAALSSPGHTVQSRLYLRGVPWLPELADDMSYRYRAVQVAGGRAVPALSWRGPTKLEAAVYGYRTEFDFGEYVLYDEMGDPTRTYHPADTSNHLGVSLALRSIVEVGVGATSKWISSDLGLARGSARAYDFGLMAVAPLTGILQRFAGRELALTPHLRPQLDLGFGMAWHNRGPRFAWADGSGDPLPANRRHGWSSRLALDWHSGSLRLSVAEVTLSRETYRPQVEGAQVTSRAEDDKSGVEVSILETISFRRGEHDDFDGELHFKTSGETIRSDGLFRYLAHYLENAPPGSSRDALLFVARHLSISWSRFAHARAWPSRGHSSLGLSLRSRLPLLR